jgi:DNA-binding NarL/FixJ family response regulator
MARLELVVADDHTLMRQGLCKILEEQPEWRVVDRYDSLSEREREVLQLIAEGQSNKEVADTLAVSPATVETHRAHIFQKLDVHNTAEVVLYAVRRGLIA